MHKIKLITLSIASLLLILSTSSYANDNYVKLDEQLKKVIAENKDATSVMKLHNFAIKEDRRIDIYQVSPESGAEFVPQDEMSIMLYNTFIDKGFLPIIAILETNKVFLESQPKNKETKNKAH